jgi:hypothetical protein
VTDTESAGSADVGVIRQSTVVHTYIALWGCVLCVIVAGMGVLAISKGALVGVVLTLAIFALAAWMAWRLFSEVVTLGSTELVARNQLKTRHIPRAEISGFSVGPMGSLPLGKCVHVNLRDKTVLPLDVTAGLYRFGRGDALLQERLATLNNWLATKPKSVK